MSALTPKADIQLPRNDGRYGPELDSCTATWAQTERPPTEAASSEKNRSCGDPGGDEAVFNANPLAAAVRAIQHCAVETDECGGCNGLL
jgi:hypothetical protein